MDRMCQCGRAEPRVMGRQLPGWCTYRTGLKWHWMNDRVRYRVVVEEGVTSVTRTRQADQVKACPLCNVSKAAYAEYCEQVDKQSCEELSFEDCCEKIAHSSSSGIWCCRWSWWSSHSSWHSGSPTSPYIAMHCRDWHHTCLSITMSTECK